MDVMEANGCRTRRQRPVRLEAERRSGASCERKDHDRDDNTSGQGAPPKPPLFSQRLLLHDASQLLLRSRAPPTDRPECA